MANRFRNRFLRAETGDVATSGDDMSQMQRARLARRGKLVVQKSVEPEDSGGLINRLRKKRSADASAEAKEKALDDRAFFGMRDDGKMVDGWPIK